jgi:hypothetical protein
VHNNPIKRPRKGSNEESKRQPKGTLVWRTGLSGAPPDSVRWARALKAELLTFGKMEGCSAIIHRTVRCASGATTTSRATVDCNTFNARLRAQRAEHAQLAHRTVYRTSLGMATGKSPSGFGSPYPSPRQKKFPAGIPTNSCGGHFFPILVPRGDKSPSGIPVPA